MNERSPTGRLVTGKAELQNLPLDTPEAARVREAFKPVTRCFACGRLIGARQEADLVDTRDSQLVYVGRECLKKIQAAGDEGYQPPLGGPKLFLIKKKE